MELFITSYTAIDYILFTDPPIILAGKNFNQLMIARSTPKLTDANRR